jgi:hypothetical protein
MSQVSWILLLEVRQGTWACKSPVRHAALVRTNRRLDPLRQPAVGLMVVAADDHVLASPPPRDRSIEIQFRPSDDRPRWPGGQLGFVDPGRCGWGRWSFGRCRVRLLDHLLILPEIVHRDDFLLDNASADP